MPIHKYKLIENYFKVNTNWEAVLNLLYKNAEGSQARPDTLWFKIKNGRLFEEMPELKDFLENINKDFDSEFFEECEFYDDWQNGICNCKSAWHMDGPVISLDNETVGKHKDIKDTAYLQILGNSFWELNGRENIVLNPGDLIFVSNKITHEVSGEGPRMGILFMAFKTLP